MDELLAQPTRRRILDDVVAHPGTSARDIQARLGLGWGETAYHLARMTRAGALRRERGGRRDFYFPAAVTWADRRILQALHSPTQRRILLALLEGGARSFGDLQSLSRISKSTASFHLSHLVDRGLVATVTTPMGRRFQLAEPDRVRTLYHAHRSSFPAEMIDSMAESFAVLSSRVP